MNSEHLSGYRYYQAIALEFAENLNELIKDKSPKEKLRLLSEAAEATERYSKIYLDAVRNERHAINIERDRLENLNNTPF